MAHPVEPMDIDSIDSDFDNKENTFHHNNVQPCTEKGYEELDVSELNMRLRYSVTPAASPMSKSFTNYHDNRSIDLDESVNTTVNKVNLTRSLNATITNNDSVVKSLKSLPLQSLPTDQPVEKSVSVLRQLDCTLPTENNNITVTVSGTNDIDENLSLPSSSSSEIQTPEATTPTKEIPKNDGGSPIMRGLKSVLNMFRSSQSPIPQPDNENNTSKQLTPTPSKRLSSEPRDKVETKTVLASTPIAAHRDKDGNGSKRSSPYKDSIIFNDDLEKELQWKDETTIIFSEEKIPIHKLFYQQKKNNVENKISDIKTEFKPNLDSTVEYMDISCNDSVMHDKTMTELGPGTNKNVIHVANESDSEFLDCETETNVTKNETNVDNKVEELNRENDVKDCTVKDITFNTDNQAIIQQIHEIDKRTLDVTIPLGSDNIPQNLENNLFSSSLIQKENVDKNKSILSNNLGTCEENLNTTKVIENISQDSNLETSSINSHQLNLDLTMTIDDQEIKDKSNNNELDVSTLESHTKSLSSLIESLDATKTIDKENERISVDNNYLEIGTSEKPIQMPHFEKQDSDITINIQENKTPGLSSSQSFVLPENIPYTTTSQNSNITMVVLNQEETIVKSNIHDSLEHEVINNTFDLINENNKNDILMSAASPQPVQENRVQEELQVVDEARIPAVEPMTSTESPADIPLPDDEEEKDVNIPTDTCDAISMDMDISMDIQLSESGRSIAEMKVTTIVENAVGAVSELNVNDNPLPDMSLHTNDSDVKNEIIIPARLEVKLSKEENSDIKNMLSQVSNVSETGNEQFGIMNDIENIDKTFDVQIPDINENVTSVLDLLDVNQKELDDVEIMVFDAPVAHTIDNVADETINKEDLNKSENIVNNLALSINKQEQQLQNDIQNNIGSAILPENQMISSILACEEILDKNREISEVILTEQKIDKLQHACDVVLSYNEVKEESSQMSQNGNQQDIISNVAITTFKKNESIVEELTEVNIKAITQETQDANKTVTVEDFKIPLGELLDNTEQKIIPKEDIISTEKDLPDDKETENKTEIIELKCEAEQEVISKEDVKELGIYKTEAEIVNKTVTVEDETKINVDTHRYVVQETLGENLKNIEKDKAIGNETTPIKLNTNDVLSEIPDLAIVDDEIIMSENNSPYVSVAADLDKVSDDKPLETFEEIENPFVTKSNVPSSPPITSKGYNFNFDDIEDPFATKVKMRMSPTPNTPNKTIEIKKEQKQLQKAETLNKDISKNRRKSQPARQKLSNMKKSFNATFDCKLNHTENDKRQSEVGIKTQENIVEKVEEQKNINIDFSNDTIGNTTSTLDDNKNDRAIPIEKGPHVENIDVVDADVTKNATLTEGKHEDITMCEVNKDLIESVTAVSNDIKTNSSSEQSTYYSAGASSNDSSKSRNVFNLPEIDDMNFNPFATKSKIRQSPPRDMSMDNPFATKSKIMNSPDSSVIVQQTNEDVSINNTTHAEKNLEDKMDTEPMEKDTSANISNSTTSSKATEKDATIREVNTEDEDTIEGPFLEAEDINEDKKSDFDGENIDMMQFNELPAQEHDDNADGELFIDAEAFEFLLNQNKSNVVADSGKESLFLKFDPLFAKRMSSDSVVAALSRAQKRQSTPKRTPRQQRNTPIPVAGPSTMNLNYEIDKNVTEATEDLNTTVTKPMMVVTPAVNPTAALRKSITPTRTNRRSITFTSPAMAVIDRLLSLSANNSLAEQEATIPQVSREQSEAELALTELREVLAEKEIHVCNLRSDSKELKDRLAALESQMKVLETEGQQRLKKINDLNDKLAEKTKMNKSMAVVVEEYERTIASLIAETEQDKKRHAEERIALMNERDEQTAHLASMEVSFNDLHSKYEKSKQVIMNYKANEETYKQSLKEFEENVTKMQKNYELLKQHATSKLNHANDELQKINRTHEAEVLKLNAMIKRKDLHITSLEETLAQKTKANEELTAICDELINKVG